MPFFTRRTTAAGRRNLSLPLLPLGALRPSLRGDNEAIIRGLCASAYLGRGTSLCRVLGRYKMFVDTADLGLSTHLLLDGYWEMWLTEAIAARLRPGMTVADIGANLGYFTVLMGDMVGPGGHVHAFEPNPAIAERLRKSVEANGYDDRTAVHVQALGEDEGLFQLVVPENEPKNAHVVPAPPEAEGQPNVLRTRRLDGYPGLAALDLLKIDVEGAEPAIWRGMTAILEQPRPLTVFLEFNPGRYPDPRGFLDEILRWGFALSLVDLVRGPERVTADALLADPTPGDRMLLLER